MSTFMPVAQAGGDARSAPPSRRCRRAPATRSPTRAALAAWSADQASEHDLPDDQRAQQQQPEHAHELGRRLAALLASSRRSISSSSRPRRSRPCGGVVLAVGQRPSSSTVSAVEPTVSGERGPGSERHSQPHRDRDVAAHLDLGALAPGAREVLARPRPSRYGGAPPAAVASGRRRARGRPRARRGRRRRTCSRSARSARAGSRRSRADREQAHELGRRLAALAAQAGQQPARLVVAPARPRRPAARCRARWPAPRTRRAACRPPCAARRAGVDRGLERAEVGRDRRRDHRRRPPPCAPGRAGSRAGAKPG